MVCPTQVLERQRWSDGHLALAMECFDQLGNPVSVCGSQFVLKALVMNFSQ
jgi:hypothetical protein